MPIPGNQLQWEQQVQQYAAELDSQFPPGPDGQGKLVDYGQDYIRYMDAHPNASPALVYQTVIARLSLLLSIPATIGKAIGTGAGAAGGLAQATTKAIPSIVPSWLQGFSWLRVAEAALGVVIIAVALDKLMDGKAGVATTIAKVVK